MRISGPGGAFIVRVHTRPGVTSYPVRLDRLWFDAFLGSEPRVGAATPGWTARLEGHRTGDDLY
jgi:hypothetical protein